jgi:hypothetical protein
MKITTPAVKCLQFDMGESEIAKTIMSAEDDNRAGTV